MTYEESIKSGHIAVWNRGEEVVTLSLLDIGFYCKRNEVASEGSTRNSSRIAVNAINKMIDSARDL